MIPASGILACCYKTIHLIIIFFTFKEYSSCLRIKMIKKTNYADLVTSRVKGFL